MVGNFTLTLDFFSRVSDLESLKLDVFGRKFIEESWSGALPNML
jgi:hypothetical protein